MSTEYVNKKQPVAVRFMQRGVFTHFSPSRLIYCFVIGGCLLISLLWGFILADLQHERELHVTQAQRNTENLSVAFEKHVQSSIVGIDALLISLRHELLENKQFPRANDMVAWVHAGPFKDSILQIGPLDCVGVCGDDRGRQVSLKCTR